MKKKLSTIALALILTMGLSIPALAASVTDFADVPANAWYYDDVPAAEYYAPYVYWASGKGIVYGLSDSTFDPNANITKEQMATILVRYATSEGLTIPADSGISFNFGDAADINVYAKLGVETLKNAGIITGNEYGNFQPQKSISRAEATTMFVKFITAVEKADDFIDCTSINATLLNDEGYSTSKMSVGEKKQIFVSYVPKNTTIDRTCTYVSGDTSIATVDANGLVTAVSTGKTYVTVTSSNGRTAVCSIDVRGAEQKLTGFELAWGNKWEIATYPDGYYCYDWTMMGETSTVTRNIGEDSGYMLLSPQVIYSDGFKQIVLPEDYGAYKFSFTSSDPSLVSISADSSIIIHRAISPSEGQRTVTITVYSGYFETSKTVTIALYAS